MKFLLNRNLMKFLILPFLLSSMITLAQKNPKESDAYTEDKLGISVTVDKPTFTIKLKSNPSTGYSWFLRSYDTRLLTAEKHEYKYAEDRKLMGAPGYELWMFRMKPAAFAVPQQTLLRFVYARPWEGTEQSTQVVFRVSSMPKK